MKTMKLFRIATAFLLVAFGAGLCFAPIEGKPPGKDFHGELSDSELEKHQRGNMTSNTPDGSPSDPGYAPSIAKSDEAAAGILSGSIPKNEAKAEASLSQAQKDMKKEKTEASSPGKMVMMGGFFLLLGLMAAFGIRTYLDKTIPDSVDPKKKKNPW